MGNGVVTMSWCRCATAMMVLIGLAASVQAPLPSSATGSGVASNVVAGDRTGTVAAWGHNRPGGPTAVPSGLSRVVALAAGSDHSLAVKEDGSVVAWGDNSAGQSAVPAALSGVRAVAAGSVHSLALKDDDTVAAWGEIDHPSAYGQSEVPPGLSGVVAIAAGYAHSLAVKGDGTVVGWGWDSYGQASPPDGLSGVVAVAGGFKHSLALKDDGTVVGWGGSDYGEASPPDGLSDVVAIAAGMRHSLALKADGTVIGWGRAKAASPPDGLSGVVAIAAGYYGDNLALKGDGTVVMWGGGGRPLPGNSTPLGLTGAVAIAAGMRHSLAIQQSPPGPDLLISMTKRGGYEGNNLYNITAGQRRWSKVKRTPTRMVTRSFYVRVVNDTRARRTFALRGSSGTAGVRVTSEAEVRYHAGRTNITEAIKSSTGWTVSLAPAARRTVRVTITGSTADSPHTFQLGATTPNRSGDTVWGGIKMTHGGS